MIGETAIGGVFLPVLLLIGMLALALTVLLSRLLALTNIYRFMAYRPLVDIALFVIILGLLDFGAGWFGLRP